MPPVSTPKDRRSSSGSRLAAIVFVLASMHAPPGWAAKVYRCGNAFQDQPCPEPKPPERRPAERSAAPRDSAPCGSPGDANGRDCVVKAPSRDAQAAAVVEVKR